MEKYLGFNITNPCHTYGAWAYDANTGWNLIATSIIESEVGKKAVEVARASGWKTKVRIGIYHLDPEVVAFQEYMKQPAPQV